MDKALIDTDIFSEILKGINQKVVAKASAYRSNLGPYSICTITVVEIIKACTNFDAKIASGNFWTAFPVWNC